MKLESVQMEKQVTLHDQESKCFSVEPVLRCLPGCFPVKTTTVTIGFHCVPAGESAETKKKASSQDPAILYHVILHGTYCFTRSIFTDSNLNTPENLRNISEKSIDLRETAEAHLACSCSAQCA